MSELTTRKESESLPIQKEMEAVLSSLANEDALKIFQEAKEGITSSTQAIKKLKLTQKRYYARLKTLIETRLIEKTDSRYELTFLGKIVYEVLYRKLVKALENKDRIALIDKLNKAKSLSKEEKDKIASTISVRDSILGYTDVFGGINPVEIIDDFGELKKKLAELVKNAQEHVSLATKYFDPTIAESLVDSYHKRKIKIRIIDGDEKNLSKKLQLVRLLMSHPRTLKLILEIADSPDIQMKNSRVPYSFMIVDGEYSVLELADPASEDFSFALFFNNKELSEKFIGIFDSMFNAAEGNGKALLNLDKLGK